MNAQTRQPLCGLWPDPVDLARLQRPYPASQIRRTHQRETVRLVELRSHLRQQLVRSDSDRAGQSCRRTHRLFDPAGDPRRVAAVRGQVDVDLVDPAVLDPRREGRDSHLEPPRVMSVGREIGRQQDCIRCKTGRGHQPHAGVHAQRSRLVGRGGHHAPAAVVAQVGEFHCAVLTHRRGFDTAPADHQRLAPQLRVAQQFHGSIEGVHVEVCNAAVHKDQSGRLPFMTCSINRQGFASIGERLCRDSRRPSYPRMIEDLADTEAAAYSAAGPTRCAGRSRSPCAARPAPAAAGRESDPCTAGCAATSDSVASAPG